MCVERGRCTVYPDWYLRVAASAPCSSKYIAGSPNATRPLLPRRRPRMVCKSEPQVRNYLNHLDLSLIVKRTGHSEATLSTPLSSVLDNSSSILPPSSSPPSHLTAPLSAVARYLGYLRCIHSHAPTLRSVVRELRRQKSKVKRVFQEKESAGGIPFNGCSGCLRQFAFYHPCSR